MAVDKSVSDLILVDVVEDVRRVNEDSQRTAHGHGKEGEQN